MFCEQVNMFHSDHESAFANDVIETGDSSSTILCKWNSH